MNSMIKRLNISGDHYKREHCWGHMILEVAGFAHIAKLSVTILFCSACVFYEGDIVISNKRVNKHLVLNMPILNLFTSLKNVQN